jgi:hypothetical protein
MASVKEPEAPDSRVLFPLLETYLGHLEVASQTLPLFRSSHNDSGIVSGELGRL